MPSFLLSRELFDISHSAAAPLFERFEYPWQVLPEIKSFILALGEALSPDEYEKRGEGTWISRSAAVAPSAFAMYSIILCASGCLPCVVCCQE